MKRNLTEFLIDNMREMELELRSHSILLEALQQGVIGPDEIPGALDMARQSPAMLGFVEEKYRQVRGRMLMEEAEGSAVHSALQDAVQTAGVKKNLGGAAVESKYTH